MSAASSAATSAAPSWEEALGAAGSAQAMRCERAAARGAHPPRVAFCLAGAARAFASPLVLESVSAATGARLRLLFGAGTGNLSACRRALGEALT